MIATLMVSALTFLTPLSSTMVAPSSLQIAEEFNITSGALINMITSIFVLAYAFGPLILGPLSEIFGRKKVSLMANIVYLAFNLGCGFANNTSQLIAFRFLSGVGGSVPFSVSVGVLADIWHTEERGFANGVFTLGAVLGTGVGPVIGAWIAVKSSWRWVFWSTSIIDAIFLTLYWFLLNESYAPTLLSAKAAKVRKELGLEKDDKNAVRTIYESEPIKWKNFVFKAMVRPFTLFAREPIIQLIGLYMTFLYGVVYLILTTIPDIFQKVRGESLGISGLHYIAHGLGAITGAYINMRTLDVCYKYFQKRNGGVGRPEYRLPFMALGTLLLPIGILIIGWTARPTIPWIATDIGLALVAGGTDLNFQPMQTYVTDAFTLHAASAMASVTFFRSLAGFGFPLFAPAMFNGLGYGLGSVVLGVATIVIGFPTLYILWTYGERIRENFGTSDSKTTEEADLKTTEEV